MLVMVGVAEDWAQQEINKLPSEHTLERAEYQRRLDAILSREHYGRGRDSTGNRAYNLMLEVRNFRERLAVESSES